MVITTHGLRSRLRFTAAAVDGAVAAVLVIGVVVTGVSGKGVGVFAVLAGCVVSATVAVRRRNPLLAILVIAVGSTVAEHVTGAHLAVAPVAFVLCYYSLGRFSAERGWRGVDAVMLVLPLPAIALGPDTSSPGNPLIVDVLSVWAFTLVMPFVSGRVVGRRAELGRALRANAERLEDEQGRRERRAATDERTRIARELHDVIAHSVSVMVIQTSAARRVADHDREAAIDAMRAVERCGRDAILDVRRMIGVLRRDEVDLTGDVAPGLGSLDRLADRASASGMPVHVRFEGEPRPLPPALDLVIYRVVQEALTNAMKHAGPARARVVVTFASDALELDIVDNGAGKAHEPVESGGQGLIGMQERVALYGGQLQAGLCSDGGFRVHARIPMHDVMPV